MKPTPPCAYKISSYIHGKYSEKFHIIKFQIQWPKEMRILKVCSWINNSLQWLHVVPTTVQEQYCTCPSIRLSWRWTRFYSATHLILVQWSPLAQFSTFHDLTKVGTLPNIVTAVSCKILEAIHNRHSRIHIHLHIHSQSYLQLTKKGEEKGRAYLSWRRHCWRRGSAREMATRWGGGLQGLGAGEVKRPDCADAWVFVLGRLWAVV